MPPAFYARDPAVVARALLGAVLHADDGSGPVRGRIVETEAYLGPDDPACHAAVGRTARNRHLFGAPGTAYVYFIYGMHWCLNAVTHHEGSGSAVLLRAVVPLTGVSAMRRRRPRARGDDALANGPGKLCAAFGVAGAHDGLRLPSEARLTILAAEAIPDAAVRVLPRVGIRHAASWPLRFVVAGTRTATGVVR